VHPSCQTLGATSAARNEPVRRYVHLASGTRAVCLALFQKRPFLSVVGYVCTQSRAALRLTAVIRVTIWQQLVCVSRQAKEVENSQRLCCKASLSKEPMYQPSFAAPGTLIADQEFTAAVSSSAARTLGTLTQAKSSSCKASADHEQHRATANASLIYGGT
jgi:hypothetical protein